MTIEFLRYIFWGEYAQMGALLLSIATESLFAIGCAKYLRLDRKLLVITASAGTLITHPVMWQLFTTLSTQISFEWRVAILEALVFLVEGLAYKLVTRYSWQLSLGLSFGANLTSYLCGVLLYRFLRQ
jgi:hypothetical protein